jgi:uncharacterized protein YjbI with pentapeptide repeats
MAHPEQLELLQQGVEVWNAWRAENPSVVPNLSEAGLGKANLSRANLSEAFLDEADLRRANLSGANLNKADLDEADLNGANLSGANLSEAQLIEADLGGAKLMGASLNGAILRLADLQIADLTGANLSRADLANADLDAADLTGADLTGADLSRTDLTDADLTEADLTGANLSGALLVRTNLVDATLTDCRVYGISAWGVKLSKATEHHKGTEQHNLVITADDESAVTVDNIEVAQFVYLLLHNEKIRDVIDTVGKKGVLLLGRFTEGRIAVLDRLRDELRKRGYLPIVFNFDKPETKNVTETVRLLAGLSHFVIADVTNPRSAPLELQATVPDIMVPFRPIIEEGEEPFAMLEGLLQYDWVFQPIYYSSLDALIGALDEKIIAPAKDKFAELLERKAKRMKGEHV